MTKREWHEISREHHDKDERHAYEFDFVIYRQKIRIHAAETKPHNPRGKRF